MNLFKVNQKEEIPTIKTFCRLVLEPESEVEFYIKKRISCNGGVKRIF